MPGAMRSSSRATGECAGFGRRMHAWGGIGCIPVQVHAFGHHVHAGGMDAWGPAAGLPVRIHTVFPRTASNAHRTTLMPLQALLRS